VGEAGRSFLNAAIQRGEIDLPVLGPRGNERRSRFPKMDGIDLIEGENMT